MKGADFEGNQRRRKTSGVWCGCLVGCIGGVGLSEAPEPHEHKETRGVVLLLFETLKGDFEGSKTTKYQFGGLGRHRETWRVVLDSQKPRIFAHCETSGCKLERAETWHLCT